MFDCESAELAAGLLQDICGQARNRAGAARGALRQRLADERRNHAWRPCNAWAWRPALADRTVVYERARQANPQRWSKQTRSWRYVDQVNLNPETPTLKKSCDIKEAA